VICVGAIGEGASATIERAIANIGANMVWVEAGGMNKNGVRTGNGQTSTPSRRPSIRAWRACSSRRFARLRARWARGSGAARVGTLDAARVRRLTAADGRSNSAAVGDGGCGCTQPAVLAALERSGVSREASWRMASASVSGSMTRCVQECSYRWFAVIRLCSCFVPVREEEIEIKEMETKKVSGVDVVV
jgi:hypothetical protein